jgi:hypothetical protein
MTMDWLKKNLHWKPWLLPLNIDEYRASLSILPVEAIQLRLTQIDTFVFHPEASGHPEIAGDDDMQSASFMRWSFSTTSRLARGFRGFVVSRDAMIATALRSMSRSSRSGTEPAVLPVL